MSDAGTTAVAGARRTVGLLLLVAAAGLLALLHFFPPPRGGLWMGTLLNTLHVPVFAVVTVLLYFGLRGATSLSERQRLGWVMWLSLFLGVVSELLQVPMQRDASLGDLLSDWLGSLGRTVFHPCADAPASACPCPSLGSRTAVARHFRLRLLAAGRSFRRLYRA